MSDTVMTPERLDEDEIDRLEGMGQEINGVIITLCDELRASLARERAMKEALTLISENYANQDIGHVDFRSGAKFLADSALIPTSRD